MNKNGFSRCADIYIGRLREEGRYSTAHVYQNALLSFSKFCGVHSVSFRQVTRDRLRRYEQHLYACGLKPNTISTYMRMLRSIYNRGVGRVALLMSTACFMRSIREWTFVRKRRFPSSLFAGFFMKTPILTVSAVPRLSPL